MKKSRFCDSQIPAVLKQAECGTPVANLLQEHGIAVSRFISGEPNTLAWMRP